MQNLGQTPLVFLHWKEIKINGERQSEAAKGKKELKGKKSCSFPLCNVGSKLTAKLGDGFVYLMEYKRGFLCRAL